jgi:NADH-ubiquinone oxidoreductase chain 6
MISSNKSVVGQLIISNSKLTNEVDLVNYINKLLFGSNSYSLANAEVHTALNPAMADTGFSSFLQIEVLGQGLYTYGALWLIILSVILLLSMVAPLLGYNKSNNPN